MDTRTVNIIYISFYHVKNHILGCDAILTASNGVITSSGYPAQYLNNLYCITRIRVAAGKRIHLNFRAFSLESHSSCAFDYVEILNGSSSMKYCGNTLPPSFVSKTNELTIKFRTDGSGVYGGFSATYSTVYGKLIFFEIIFYEFGNCSKKRSLFIHLSKN